MIYCVLCRQHSDLQVLLYALHCCAVAADSRAVQQTTMLSCREKHGLHARQTTSVPSSTMCTLTAALLDLLCAAWAEHYHLCLLVQAADNGYCSSRISDRVMQLYCSIIHSQCVPHSSLPTVIWSQDQQNG